jgi:hypothetical protein
LSQTLLRAFGYYERSVAMKLSLCRRSRSSLHAIVCP